MSSYLKTNDLLDTWVKGELTIENLAQELGLSPNETARQSTIHRAALQSIAYAAVQKQVASVHQSFLAETSPRKEKAIVRSLPAYKWAMRIAASGVVMAGLFLGRQLFFSDGNDLYQSFFQNYTTITERSEANYEHSMLIDAFRNKDFEKVIAVFTGSNDVSTRDKFLAGYAFLQMEKPAEAITLFNEIQQWNQQNHTLIYQDEAEYYQAIAYLQAGNGDKAYELLHAISQNPEHTYFDAVSKWDLLRLKFSSF
jgi:tetratricopeptide (TPR) repeat protein